MGSEKSSRREGEPVFAAFIDLSEERRGHEQGPVGVGTCVSWEGCGPAQISLSLGPVAVPEVYLTSDEARDLAYALEEAAGADQQPSTAEMRAESRPEYEALKARWSEEQTS